MSVEAIVGISAILVTVALALIGALWLLLWNTIDGLRTELRGLRDNMLELRDNVTTLMVRAGYQSEHEAARQRATNRSNTYG